MKTIFSLIPLYAVLSWIYLIMISLGMVNIPHNAIVFTSILVFVLGAFTTISTIVSVFIHITEVQAIKVSENNLANAEEYLNEVKDHIKIITEKTELDENVLAKSNVDHPIVSALNKLTNAQGRVETMKNYLSTAKSKIQERKNGPFKWVVDVYGE